MLTASFSSISRTKLTETELLLSGRSGDPPLDDGLGAVLRGDPLLDATWVPERGEEEEGVRTTLPFSPILDGVDGALPVTVFRAGARGRCGGAKDILEPKFRYESRMKKRGFQGRIDVVAVVKRGVVPSIQCGFDPRPPGIR